MDYRRAFRISSMLGYAGLAVFFLTALAASMTRSAAPALCLLGLTALLSIAALCIRSAYYRCPHCNEELSGIRGPIPKHCPHCGKPLE